MLQPPFASIFNKPACGSPGMMLSPPSGNGFGALLGFELDGSLRGTFIDDDRIADPRGLKSNTPVSADPVQKGERPLVPNARRSCRML
jgi:hypothetical protein